MKIGIDFGSTYSTIAQYNERTQTVEAFAQSEGESVSIPSVVSVHKTSGQVACGQGAKSRIGKKFVRIFEAFKMLLTSADEAMLASRGYDETYTPREITKLYLSSLLENVLEKEHARTIEKLVVCVPEIWGKNVVTLDGRTILREVLQDILRGIIKDRTYRPDEHIRIVTEPEAASAYFAYNYEQETKKRFNGHLLLIDYGGGTLDITLTEVISGPGESMEIIYREGDGAGENHFNERGENEIGSAGFAYMQRVVLLALRDGRIVREDETPDFTAPDYASAVSDLETQLKSVERIKEIEQTFGHYRRFEKMKEILRQPAKEFLSIEYLGEEVPVTYQHLYLAYHQIIAPVLESKILAICEKVEAHIGRNPRDVESGQSNDFKIAIVGGFGSFYLVRKQLASIFSFDANANIDPRLRGIAASKREQAIALGAALLAADKVLLQKTARFSIGLGTIDNDRDRNITGIYYGIHYHQVIKPGVPYYILHKPGLPDIPKNRKVWGSLRDNIDFFMMEWTDRLDWGGVYRLKSEILDKLKGLPSDLIWECGFSMDDSDVITFHASPHSLLGEQSSARGIEIELDNYKKMFHSDVKEVHLGEV